MDNTEIKLMGVDNNIVNIDLDTILVNEIGQFGRFQIRTFCIAAVLAMFTAFSACEFVFTTARIPTRCVIPECEGVLVTVLEWSPSWLSNAIPATGAATFDNCHRFGNTSNTSILVQVNNNTCPRTLFDRDTVQKCEEYVYENTDSVVYDFQLACDEWSRSSIPTIMTIGTFFAMPLTGYMSDRWGRRITLTMTAFNTAWIGVLRYWAHTYIGFTISKFVEAVLGNGCFACVYVLLVELVGPKYRVLAGAMMNTFFSLGQVLNGLIAWGVPNWRYLTLVLYIPQLFTIICFWTMPESVRWYITKGRMDEAKDLLKKVAKINDGHLCENSIKSLKETTREDAYDKGEKEAGSICELFRHKRIILRVLVSPVWWITKTFIYHGLSINAVNLSGNRYLKYVAVSAVEIPGYWTAVFLIERVGRKVVLILSFWVCAACQIAYIFLRSDQYAWSLAVYLIGTYSISIVVSAVYVYTAELYPTKYRNSFLAYSSMMGRIGAILALLTPAMVTQWGEELPFMLFAGFALLSSALVFMTPETLGSKLPDTFKEAVQMGL